MNSLPQQGLVRMETIAGTASASAIARGWEVDWLKHFMKVGRAMQDIACPACRAHKQHDGVQHE